MKSKRVCASCGGAQLVPGKLKGYAHNDIVFVPEVKSWFSYAARFHGQAYVCAACGFIAHYLDVVAIEKINKKRA